MTGFIFDMDGVLCDSESFIAEAACRMFATVYQVEVNPADFKPFVGMGEDRYLMGVAAKHGIELELPRDKETTYRIYAELVKERLQPVPGVVSFIHRAVAAGIGTAVATSADKFKMEVNLRAIGIDDSLFNALITGSDIENKKPAPDIFLTAAQRMGIPPRRCVVFEDALTGVEAAKAAGARCVAITTSFPEKKLLDGGADRVISDFTGLDPLSV